MATWGKAPAVWLLIVHLATFSQAFMRNSLVRESWPHWQADQKCRDRGYDGLAVLDTPSAWDTARALLASQNLASNEEVWIGLEYDTVQETPHWLGGRPYLWGAWATGQPDWSRHGVLVAPDGSGNFAWKTKGTNYEHLLLCRQESSTLKMSRVPNHNVDLAGATPLGTETTTVIEECGVLCGSVAGCAFFTFDGATGTCSTYDQTVSDAVAADSGTPSAFVVYQMAAF